jgi:hypothetical protein
VGVAAVDLFHPWEAEEEINKEGRVEKKGEGGRERERRGERSRQVGQNKRTDREHRWVK